MAEVVAIKDVISTENQTPIEIALEIDANGWTTAKKLYYWLELDPTHFSRWCEERILNNPYVDEMEFSPLRAKTSDKGGRPFQDYAISSNLAKMLAISSKSEKGEAVRQYYQKLENALKITVKQYNELLNNYNTLSTKINKLSTKLIANTETTDKLECRVACIESGISVSGGKLSPWVKEMSSKVMELADCYGETVKKTYSRIITHMQDKFGIFF